MKLTIVPLLASAGAILAAALWCGGVPGSAAPPVLLSCDAAEQSPDVVLCDDFEDGGFQ